ncbi:hypothetical protein KQI84_01240 [bacterium]|nr:hypothetical protein [bacterium]
MPDSLRDSLPIHPPTQKSIVRHLDRVRDHQKSAQHRHRSHQEIEGHIFAGRETVDNPGDCHVYPHTGEWGDEQPGKNDNPNGVMPIPDFVEKFALGFDLIQWIDA